MELASWWNWHLGRTGILPVSIYFRAGRMPTLLLLIPRFSNADAKGGALPGGLSQHWRSGLNMMASPPLTLRTLFLIHGQTYIKKKNKLGMRHQRFQSL
ncbi:hypothetical protein [Moorena sp. SIO4G3]|uniref:hypothetical protein n=1 Tax=Moorena sp. SIO4G3 TaxID=2607821 RepID=UPI0025F30EF3|nr:hypothetical protein [Moorena sp. SIO4G3]